MPDIYEIRLRGHLDNCWSNRFDDFTISNQEDGTTLLVGPVPDQAALHGLLIRVRDLGLVLLSIVHVKSEQSPAGQMKEGFDNKRTQM